MLQRNLRAMIIGINHTTWMGHFCWLLLVWVSKGVDVLLVCNVKLHCVDDSALYMIISRHTGVFSCWSALINSISASYRRRRRMKKRVERGVDKRRGK